MNNSAKQIGTASNLSIIVPIFRYSKNAKSLHSWIFDPIIQESQIILVHDLTDGEDIQSLKDTILEFKNIVLVESMCGSPGASRNVGLPLAERSWITFWDCDDQPQVENFIKMIEQGECHNSDICVGSYKVIFPGGEQISRILESNRKLQSRLPRSVMVNPGIWRWTFRRELISDFKFSKEMLGEDQFFLAQIQAHDSKIFFYDEPVYVYTMGLSSQITNQDFAKKDLESSARKLIRIAQISRRNTRLFANIAVIHMLMNYLRSTYGVKASAIKKMQILQIILFRGISSPLAVYLLIRELLNLRALKESSKSREAYVFLAGGLGNQLFQISFAANIPNLKKIYLINPSRSVQAMLLEKKIKQSTNDGGNKETDIVFLELQNKILIKLRNFGLRLSSQEQWKENKFFKFIVSVMQVLLSIMFKSKISLLIPSGVGYDPRVLDRRFQRKCIVIGYFQSHIWAQALRYEFKSYLDQLVSQSNELQTLVDGVKFKDSILVHVRLGDYLNQKNNRFGVVTVQYLSNSYNYMKRFCQDAKVMLFSNDLQLALEMAEQAFFEDKVEVCHLENDLEALAFFTFGTNYILSNSTFGWWGAFLSQGSPNRVCIPKIWFKEMSEPANLCPDSWIRI